MKNFLIIFFLFFLLVGCQKPVTEELINGINNSFIVSVKDISANEAFDMLQTNEYEIIDIRTSEEFETGHIKGAKNIDFYDEDFELEIAQLDKTKKYLYYCRSGSRSRSAASIFERYGFTDVYHMKNGINEWDYPLEK